MFTHRYKIYGIFLACIIVGLGILFLITNNYYPILLVNSQPISAHRFWQVYQSTVRYYQNVLTTYSGKASSTIAMPGQAELEANVLDQLVESTLVADGVHRELGADAGALVADRVEKYRANADLARAAQALYGLSYADFESEVLVPQAEKDILSGRLFLKGQKIEDWLREARNAAHVTIFSSGFNWDGKTITSK